MRITAAEIKDLAAGLGADLCGIGDVDRFAGAPPGFHPADIHRDAKSVIVVAARFPAGTLAASSQAPYTFVRNRLMEKVDAITFALTTALEEKGATAVPIPSSEPYEYWDEAERRGMGILSLKHAAVRAGLGVMGKNTLLLNNRFGNMVWLGAVLVDRALDADPLASYQPCPPSCRLCLDSCPAQALDGVTLVQKKCRPICGKSSPGGGVVYACNLCRKICPNHLGFKRG
ncbi:MAG TPA: epoxyqueuosine reductase [Negativicutes bacterium]|nr:epoxyqueuosine reductase [Negativicutes bacterium]